MDLATPPLPLLQHRAVPRCFLRSQPLALLSNARLPPSFDYLPSLWSSWSLPIPLIWLGHRPLAIVSENNAPTCHHRRYRPNNPIFDFSQRSALHLPPSPPSPRPLCPFFRILLPSLHNTRVSAPIPGAPPSSLAPSWPRPRNCGIIPSHNHKPSTRAFVSHELSPIAVHIALSYSATFNVGFDPSTEYDDSRFPDAMSQHTLAKPSRLLWHQSVGLGLRTSCRA